MVADAAVMEEIASVQVLLEEDMKVCLHMDELWRWRAKLRSTGLQRGGGRSVDAAATWGAGGGWWHCGLAIAG